MNRQRFVSYLTAVPRERHKPDTGPAVRRAPHLALVLLAAGASGASDWHDPSAIAAAAEQYLRERVAAPGSDTGATRLSAQGFDQRLRLAACDRPLEGFMRPGTRIAARTIVGIRCGGSRPWKVYVPVDMTVSTSVWVARRPLPRGHVLTGDDLVAETRDVSGRATGYVNSRNDLVGHRLKTSVLAGRVLEPHFVEADIAIRRGQSVTLAVEVSGIEVRMSGKALADGALNQRIRVENHNSGRVVEGIVRSRELVEVLMPAAGQIRNPDPKVSAAMADTGISNNEN